MEPLKIEIQIGLKDETISAMKQLLLASIAAFMETVNACQGTPAQTAEEPAPEEAPKAEEKPAEAAEPAPAADDMPDFTEAFPEVSDKEIADATRATVVRLREAGISPTIIRKEVFEKYGISQSTECPKEKRGQLIADLNALGK